MTHIMLTPMDERIIQPPLIHPLFAVQLVFNLVLPLLNTSPTMNGYKMLPFVKYGHFSIYKAVILLRGNPKTNKKN